MDEYLNLRFRQVVKSDVADYTCLQRLGVGGTADRPLRTWSFRGRASSLKLRGAHRHWTAGCFERGQARVQAKVSALSFGNRYLAQHYRFASANSLCPHTRGA